MKEILDRANVGRSTFDTHFRDKDDLLESGIHEILTSIRIQPRSASAHERVLAFSLPLLKHIDEHRRTAGPRMKDEGRVIMHEHMQDVLMSLIADQLAMMSPGRSKVQIPTGLLARYVAAAFVLVLNWWVENDSPLSPVEVDARFRALVVPTLAAL